MIKGQIGDDLFELGVLFAQLAQFADLGRAQLAKALRPDVEGRFRDAEFASGVAPIKPDTQRVMCWLG